jgi:NAD-dependent dihydropyrimidine dehydrogenase PreA subunit
MPISFPKTRDGADIRVLQFLFTEDEARLALHLDYLPKGLDIIQESLGDNILPLEELEKVLDEMCRKGAITGQYQDNAWEYFLHPWVVGLYEMALISAWQDGRPAEPLQNTGDDFARKFFLNTVVLDQLMFRTIPINQSIVPEHNIATYDEVRKIIGSNHGKFILLPCVCKTSKKGEGTPCTRTNRIETCMGLGHYGEMGVKTGLGREISRDEALEIVRKNEEDGLVFQTENSKKPNWLCGCCGDCCTILNSLKALPKPAEFARGNFQASLNYDSCVGCGICAKRCNMDAIAIGVNKIASINLDRCIGCGVCVPTCKTGAIRLRRRDQEEEPKDDLFSYMNMLDATKKNGFQKIGRLLKIFLKR